MNVFVVATYSLSMPRYHTTYDRMRKTMTHARIHIFHDLAARFVWHILR